MKISFYLITTFMIFFSCITTSKPIYEGQSIDSFHRVLLKSGARDITNSIGTLFQESEYSHKYYHLKNKKIILVWYHKKTEEMGPFISITKKARETTKTAEFNRILHDDLILEIKKEETEPENGEEFEKP